MTEQQIDKYVVRLIRQRYSIDTEQKLSRILHGAALQTYVPSLEEMQEVQEYQVYVEQCREIGKQMIVEHDLIRRTEQYNQALARLNKYKLEDGRPEEIIPPVYKEGYEDLPEDERPILEQGYTIKAIEPVEPLMLTRDIYDEEGNITGTEEYLNPIIEKDRAEREAAQQIVDNYVGE